MKGEHEVLVIGAGLAGLTAARILQKAGKQVLLLEKNQIGGRIASDWQDGFLLDRGYGVLFPAYPALRRQVDIQSLGLVSLRRGALVRLGNTEWTLDTPDGNFLSSLTNPILSTGDHMKLASLAAYLFSKPAFALLNGPDQSTEAFLRMWGLSERSIDLFFRPFFGGIFLDTSLSTSARLFRYYLRMILEGGVALPAQGMGMLPTYLANGLQIQQDTAEQIEQKDGYVNVYTEQTVQRAQHVIVATDPPELARLTGLTVPWHGIGATYLSYTTSSKIPDTGGRIILSPKGPIVHAHWLSSVLPERVPSGQALLNVTVHGTGYDLQQLDKAVRKQLTTWYDALPLETLEIRAIPYAQFSQPAGYAQHLLEHATSYSNVIIASEITSMSGIGGAIESGEKAAALILNDTMALARPHGA